MWEECGKIEAVLCRGIAQLVEHRSPKPGVGGSSPSAPASFMAPGAFFCGKNLAS